MTGDDSDLRARFAALRVEELEATPPFRPGTRTRRSAAMRWIVVTATLLLMVAVVTIRSRTTFSDADRAVVRSIAAWHAPTEFLLRPPGADLMTSTPRIPDLKGIPR